jgi:hypothetical protein
MGGPKKRLGIWLPFSEELIYPTRHGGREMFPSWVPLVLPGVMTLLLVKARESRLDEAAHLSA